MKTKKQKPILKTICILLVVFLYTLTVIYFTIELRAHDSISREDVRKEIFNAYQQMRFSSGILVQDPETKEEKELELQTWNKRVYKKLQEYDNIFKVILKK